MNEYTAIIQQSGDWWIGWVAEVPGALAQEATREELLESLESALKDMLELNREDTIADIDGAYEEERIVVQSGKRLNLEAEIDKMERARANSTGLYKTDAEGNIIQSGYPHIVFKNTGAPMIEGTRIKVQVIAIDNQRWGLSPEQILEGYAGLTLGEIYSALAYYWDHKDEIDQQIEDERKFVKEMRRRNEPHQREMERKIKARAKEMGLL